MANFEGFTPHAIERLTSLYEQSDVTNAPLGVSAVCRNGRFEGTEAGTRFGVNQKVGNGFFGLNMNTGFPVTGMGCFKYEGNGLVPDKTVPLVFDYNGALMIESPPGSGTMVAVVSAQVTPGAGRYMQADQTLNRAYAAFTNLANPDGTSANAVYDLSTGILDPLSMRPVGEQFKKGETYRVGECVIPILPAAGGNGLASGRLFRVSAITTGISANVEPAWPNSDGGVVVSGGVTFTENTPLFTTVINQPQGIIAENGNLSSSGLQPSSGLVVTCNRNAGAGTFAAARDIYIAITLVNGNGETITLTCFAGAAIINTVLNDQLSVKVTTSIRAWVAALAGLAACTGWNLYVADVATGAAPPATLALYGKVGGGPFSVALNTIVTVGVSPAGSGSFSSTISPGVGDVTGDITPTIGVGKTIVLPDGSRFVQGPNGLLPVASPGAGVPLNNTAFLISAPGNLTQGTRYCVVLFVNRNGCISGYGNGFFVIGSVFTGGLQIQMFNIPIGPPETAQRIVAFSQSGGTQAGPFAYVPGNDTQNGIPVTATLINDNTTTSGTFNFTDSYLEDLMATTANVTGFFDKIQLPALRSVSYSKTLDRMIYMPYLAPSGAYITPKRDPETVFASTGLFQCAETDGQSLMGLADWNGLIYGLKEASGYEVGPDNANPSNWGYVKRWDKKGPCGLRAWAVGELFIVFVHKSGIYAFFGDKPMRITREIPKTWKRVNWAAASTIWAAIDDNTHEIKIGLPLDRATVPSHELCCNFEESKTLDPPVHSTVYSRGKFISSAAARKWSLNDIPANQGMRVERTVLNAPAQFDSATVQSQFWYASSFDSAVRAVTPDYYYDDFSTAAIPWVNETVCPGDALKVSILGGVQALATGQGSIGVTVLAGSVKATQEGGVNNRQTEINMKDMIVRPGLTTDYKCQGSGMNERYRIRFSTIGKAPGTWGRVMNATLYTRPIFQSRAN